MPVVVFPAVVVALVVVVEDADLVVLVDVLDVEVAEEVALEVLALVPVVADS